VLPPEQAQSLRELCERYGVIKLWVFGSAFSDDFNAASSDVDLLVEFGPPVGMSLAAQYFDFWEELKTFFGREVDLVEKKAIRNPYFLAAVTAQERLLYAA
jgi:predicted nucleotidyltransferase